MTRRAIKRRRRGAGFTLVELMVSLVMFSFAIAGVLAVAVSLANGFREQRTGVGTETAARGVMEFLGDAVRGASPGIPTGMISVMDDTSCGTGVGTAGPAPAFSVVQGTAAPDELTAVFAYGSVVVNSIDPYTNTTTQLELTDASQFAAGDFFVITDYGVAALVKVIGKSGNVVQFTSAVCGDTISIARGALVVRAIRARFYIADLDGIPTLFMDPEPTSGVTGDEEPLAEGVEDLQIVLGVDATGDGLGPESTSAGGDEWEGNVTGDAALAGSLRAVRVSLVARAVSQVSGTGTYTRPGIEDHVAGTAPDAFRRRVLTSTIEVRNMGGSQ